MMHFEVLIWAWLGNFFISITQFLLVHFLCGKKKIQLSIIQSQHQVPQGAFCCEVKTLQIYVKSKSPSGLPQHFHLLSLNTV